MSVDIQIKKVSELGYNFPIGIQKNDQLLKEFDFKHFPTSLEKQLGLYRKANQLYDTQVVTKFLSLIFNNIGGESVDFVSAEGREQEGKGLFKVGQLFMADVFYAYCLARIRFLGELYSFGYNCPRCRHSGPVKADLTTMDVFCIDDPTKLIKKVDLFHGFKSPDGKQTIKEVEVFPQKWNDMETTEFAECGEDDILLKLYFLSKCVKYTGKSEKKEYTIGLNDSQIEALSKIDRERIANAITSINLGPSLQLDMKCPKCAIEFKFTVDWRYDSFFSIFSP